LTLAGYSIGRVLLSKRRQRAAELTDGIILALLVALTVTVQLPQGWAPHLAWPGLALIVGITHTIIARPSPDPAINQSNQPEEARPLLKWLWAAWKSFAFRLGNFQGRLILMLFYFTILMPFGIINSVFRDPLCLKQSDRTSYWFELHNEPKEIQDARRQF
jgi:hypothetical protein